MKNIDFESVGKNIKLYRQMKKYSQEELADLLGVSVRHIAYVENGTKQVSLSLLVDIANVLNVPIGGLLEDCLFMDTDSDFFRIVSVINQCSPKEADILIKAVSDLYTNISRFKID